MKHLLLAVAAVAVISFPASAQPDQDRYILQERCGNKAAATFKSEWGANIINTDKGSIRANYQNHYSERLNKCFYLQTSTDYQTIKGKSENFESMWLFDINENKKYATYEAMGYAVTTCVVEETQCTSEQEFLQLIKRFMEN